MLSTELQSLLPRTIYLSPISPTSTSSHLLSFASTFGPVVRLSLHPPAALLTFSTPQSAHSFSKAVNSSNNPQRAELLQSVDERALVVISNLPAECSEDNLEATLDRSGLVLCSKLVKTEDSRATGTAIAQFLRAQDAETVIRRYDGQVLGGQVLEVRVAEDASAARTLYVRGFSSDFSEQELYTVFSPYGTIEAASVKLEQICPFAVVEFTDRKEAEQAIAALHGKMFRGVHWFVSIFEPKSQRVLTPWKQRNLIVTGLPPLTDESTLLAAFSPFGEIESLRVNKSQFLSARDGRSREMCNGVGYVCFETEAAAREAGKRPVLVGGVRVNVMNWVPKEERGVGGRARVAGKRTAMG